MGFPAKKTTRVIFPLKKHTRAVFLLHHTFGHKMLTTPFQFLAYIKTCRQLVSTGSEEKVEVDPSLFQICLD
jgi:hypothetical protein